MKKILQPLLLLSITILTMGAENQTEVELCSRCSCELASKSLITNCKDKNITWSPQEWLMAIQMKNISTDGSIVLVLSNNNIKELQELPMINVTNIDIYLSGCNLQKIQLNTFKNMKNINLLDLGYNQLTGDAVRGDIFKGPFNLMEYEPIDLETLNLEHNLIHSLDRRTFLHTPKLKYLHLNDNPMNVIDSMTILALSSASKLKSLDLSRIGIKTIPDGIFNNLKQLEDLFLSGNKLTTVPENIGSLGSSLQYFNIDDNKIEILTDNSFVGLWRLEMLEICNMDTLTTIKDDAFIQLKSLKILRIQNNKNLEYISEKVFESHNNWTLNDLYLQNNSLKSIPINLAPWEMMDLVNLEDNPWDCDCVTITNLIAKKLQSKLLKSSSSKCISPIWASGKDLEHITESEVCPFDSNQDKKSKKSQMFARPNLIIISFSIVVIVVFLGMIVGLRITYYKNKLRETGTTPIRYTNINSEYSM